MFGVFRFPSTQPPPNLPNTATAHSTSLGRSNPRACASSSLHRLREWFGGAIMSVMNLVRLFLCVRSCVRACLDVFGGRIHGQLKLSNCQKRGTYKGMRVPDGLLIPSKVLFQCCIARHCGKTRLENSTGYTCRQRTGNAAIFGLVVETTMHCAWCFDKKSINAIKSTPGVGGRNQ